MDDYRSEILVSDRKDEIQLDSSTNRAPKKISSFENQDFGAKSLSQKIEEFLAEP